MKLSRRALASNEPHAWKNVSGGGQEAVANA